VLLVVFVVEFWLVVLLLLVSATTTVVELSVVVVPLAPVEELVPLVVVFGVVEVAMQLPKEKVMEVFQLTVEFPML